MIRMLTAWRWCVPLSRLGDTPEVVVSLQAEKQPDGLWKIFTGNEIGALLAHWQARGVTVDVRGSKRAG